MTDLELVVGLAVVDIFGCQHGDAGVTVLGVVPDKERPAEGDSVLDRAKPIGKARVILEGLELGFGEGIMSYCQKLCIEPSGGDLFLFFSVHELETFNDFGNAPVAL